MKLKRIFLALIVSVNALVFTSAFNIPSRPSSYISDYASMMDTASREGLEAKVRAFTASTTHELAVVTVPTLDGDSIEEMAVKLFESWGIGKQGKDNGVLLLIAQEEKKIRIEVGYGLEGILPDSVAARIINETIRPEFQKGNFGNGVILGAEKIMSVASGEILPAETKSKTFGQGFWEFIAQTGIFFIVFLFTIFASTKSWWLGGVVGFSIGGVLAYILGFALLTGIITVIFVTLLGLIFDYIASKAGIRGMGGPGMGSFGGGFGGGSRGGGFGGFGGGRSGGGGASGGW